MKLSAKTFNVLKNFSTINPSILIKEGSTLSTISPTKTILAKATVPDMFPCNVAIYDLSRFIRSVSLFENPDFDFGEKSVTIRDELRSIVYHYAEPSVILTPPDKQLKLPSVDVECVLTRDNLNSVMKALAVLGLPELALVGDGESVHLQAADSKNTTADTYSIKIGDTDKTFRAVFRSENLKLIDGDYSTQISSKGLAHLTGPDASYYIAIESTSTF